jgi:hypothetical protein
MSTDNLTSVWGLIPPVPAFLGPAMLLCENRCLAVAEFVNQVFFAHRLHMLFVGLRIKVHRIVGMDIVVRIMGLS